LAYETQVYNTLPAISITDKPDQRQSMRVISQRT
jgi:hypothetical protein